MIHRSILFLVLLFSTTSALAQSQGDLQTKVKAAYIFNFLKFVDWPSLDAANAAEPIRVGVIGRDPIANLLGELNGRQIRGRTLVIERYQTALPKPVTCHLLFISQNEAQRLPSLLQQLDVAGVLTVSDIANFAVNGGVIGFINDEGRVKIQINLRAARQHGLKISAKLLEVATVIQ